MRVETLTYNPLKSCMFFILLAWCVWFIVDKEQGFGNGKTQNISLKLTLR